MPYDVIEFCKVNFSNHCRLIYLETNWSRIKIWMKIFYSRKSIPDKVLRKCMWKCCLQNMSYFVLPSCVTDFCVEKLKECMIICKSQTPPTDWEHDSVSAHYGEKMHCVYKNDLWIRCQASGPFRMLCWIWLKRKLACFHFTYFV